MSSNIEMSACHKFLEEIFGMEKKGELSKSGKKYEFEINPVESKEAGSAAKRITYLVLLTVVSLVAFIVLCGMRCKLKGRVEQYNSVVDFNASLEEINRKSKVTQKKVSFLKKPVVSEGIEEKCKDANGLKKGTVVIVRRSSGERQFAIVEKFHPNRSEATEISVRLKPTESGLYQGGSCPLEGISLLTSEQQAELEEHMKS